jgi:hypothetical protein
MGERRLVSIEEHQMGASCQVSRDQPGRGIAVKAWIRVNRVNALIDTPSDVVPVPAFGGLGEAGSPFHRSSAVDDLPTAVHPARPAPPVEVQEPSAVH